MEFVQAQPFDEALAKLGARSPVASTLNSAQWRDAPVAIRERSFFSSQVESVRFLQRGKDSIADFLAGARDPDTGALKTGSRAAFVQQMQKFALAEGMGPLKPHEKGTIKDITSEGQLGLIFDVQTKAARDYGNWKQGMDPALLDEFPAQRFIRVRKVRKPRPYHQAALGTVRLKTDLDFWIGLNRDFGVPWGPWGYNSGCDVEDVDRAATEKLGLLKRNEPVRTVDRDFNEGLQASLAGLDPDLRKALAQSLGDRAELDGDVVRWKSPRAPAAPAAEPPAQPAPVPVSDAVRVEVTEPTLAAKVNEAVAAIDQVNMDGELDPLPIRAEPLAENEHGRYDPETRSIVINPDSPEPGLTVAHETFHALLDQVIAPGADLVTASQAEAALTGGMRVWYDALAQSDPAVSMRYSIARFRRGTFVKQYKYLLRPEELLCRSYAQYIARRSGNAMISAELDAVLQTEPNRTWSDDEFEPIMAAIDAALAERGWR